MAELEPLFEGMRLVEELLFEEMLRPDPARSDWASLEGRVQLVGNTVRKSILETLPANLDAAGEGAPLSTAVANLLGAAGALLFAAGDKFGSDRLLSRAAEIAPQGPLRDELLAGRRDPRAFCHLNHARWLLAHGRGSLAKAPLRAVTNETQEAALKRAAREAPRAPRPLTSAPPLFRLNGFGMGIYGSRDARGDGSYVTTYCLSALWIPILPLAAYRVRQVEGNRYQFLSREPLGRGARGFQLALLLAALGWGGYAGLRAYLESPWRLARVGVEEAQRLERSGKSSEAMTQYLTTVSRFADRADVTPAAEGVLRLAAASVKEPCRPEDVAVAGRVVAAYDRLPVSARSGAPTAHLSRRLLGWSDQIGTTDASHVRAALSVLDLAAHVGEKADAATVATRRKELRRTLADALAASDRPMDALSHYLMLDDVESFQAAQEAIASFGDGPSLWAEAAPEVRQWIDRAAKTPERAATAAQFEKRLEQAAAATAASSVILETGNEKRIAAALARAPRDQELTVGLAGVRRQQGDAPGCLSLLAALGPPGHLTGDAQRLLGACAADTGDLIRGEKVLAALLDERLPAFVRARKEYFGATDQLERKLEDQADRGLLPADVNKAIEAAPQNKKSEVFQKWVDATMSKDARLGALRAEYLRHGAVVGASLTLGSVELRRAGDSTGDERRIHLEGAERAFLSVREEAEGGTSFHLGLGQVLYRLGKVEEGAKELQSLLDRKEPDLTLAVANAYRELGIDTRTREIAEALYASATSPEVRLAAASTRAYVFIDLDDEELWLSRSDPRSSHVQTRLLETRAYRLLRDGKNAEADRSFAQAVEIYDRRSAHEPSAANNAAIALMGRYSATGDLVHMRGAVARLEASARLAPDDAILLGNLASALEDLSNLAVLERWVRGRDLLANGSEAAVLLSSMSAGPLRDEVLDALRKEPSFQRQLDVTRQEQILAPQKPEPYFRQLHWLRWNHDTAGLEALTRLVDQVTAIDQGDPEVRQVWRSGAKDAQGRADAQKVVRRSEERVRRVEKIGHAPTIACAYLLYADDLDTLAYYDPSPEAYAASAAAYRRASAAWPEVAASTGLADALVKVAGWRAAGSAPSLKAAMDKERRIYSIVTLLHRAATGSAGAEVLAALRRQPEMAEAARLRRLSSTRLPGLTDWIVARLAGDEALERAAASAFARRDLALSLSLDVKLRPGSEEDQSDLALFNAHRVPAGGS
jgi:hypothetical protein